MWSLPDDAKISQWRTWSGLLIIGCMMLGALGIVVWRKPESGPMLLSTVVTGLGGIGLWLAGTHAAEHVANAAAAGKAAVASAGQPDTSAVTQVTNVTPPESGGKP